MWLGLIGPFYLPLFHTHTVFDSQICEMSQFQYQHTRGGWNAGLEYWVRCRFEFQSQYKIHCSICLRGNRIISFCVTISFQPFHLQFFFSFNFPSWNFYRTFHFLYFFFCCHSLALLFAINQSGNMMRLCLGVRRLSTIAIVQISYPCLLS